MKIRSLNISLSLAYHVSVPSSANGFPNIQNYFELMKDVQV